MATTREHAFANGVCVHCPLTETSVNQMRAENKTPPACEERWIDDASKPHCRAADDFDAIRDRLTALRAGQKTAPSDIPPPADD